MAFLFWALVEIAALTATVFLAINNHEFLAFLTLMVAVGHTVKTDGKSKRVAMFRAKHCPRCGVDLTKKE